MSGRPLIGPGAMSGGPLSGRSSSLGGPGSHARRASEGSLSGLERRAEIAFQRDRDRDGGGWAQQLTYFNRLPLLWRILYVVLAILVVLGLLMKVSGKGRPAEGGSAAPAAAVQLDGRNITKAYARKIPAVKTDPRHFVRRDGARLVLDGKPFYFNGFCNYYMLTRGADKNGSGRKEAIQTLQKAQELGLTVLRMWAFADGPDEWNALQPALEHLDEDVFMNGLDWLVAEARNYGIRLLLSLTNGDTGFGGIEQYVKWFKGTTITDFYTKSEMRESFKKYVGTLITRKNSVTEVYYRDDPTILGWEIANEPSNPGDDIGDVLQDWIEDVAAYVKKLDPNHVVSVGVIGWFGASTPERLAFNPPAENVNNPLAAWHHPFDAACLGTDFTRNQMGSNIDVMMLHMYPDSWLTCSEECKRDWTVRWMRSHFEDALQAGKPVILGEFGKLHYGGMVQRRQFLELVYSEVEAWNEKHGNVAGTLLWMLATDTYADYDAFTIYTTKRASAAPQPKWSDVNAASLLQLQVRREFLNWDKLLECTMRRATAPRPDGVKPAVSGWNHTLGIISHAASSTTRAS